MEIDIRINEDEHEHHHKHHHHKIVGRFAGAYYTNPKGQIIVANQTVLPSTAVTAPLVFTQDGATIKGPVGEVLCSDPTVTPSLSADGQAVNFVSPALAGTLTLKWHILDASVAPFSVDVDVAAVAPPPPPPGPIIGSFGTFVPGVTP